MCAVCNPVIMPCFLILHPDEDACVILPKLNKNLLCRLIYQLFNKEVRYQRFDLL